MSTNQNSNLVSPQGQKPTRRQFLKALAILPASAVLPALSDQMLPIGNTPAPIQALHTAIDEAIHQLIGFKTQLWRAQEAGLTTVDLEDPDTGELRKIGIDLAIEGVMFATQVEKAKKARGEL